MSEGIQNIEKDEAQIKNVGKSVNNPHRNVNVFTFALVTLLVLIFALGSLTIVSSRQASLAGAEADLNVLQERMTATIFLSLDATASSIGEKIDTVSPELIRDSYLDLNKRIDIAKSEIAEGRDFSEKEYENSFNYILDGYSLDNLSTDMLLGILLISSGILGSIMSTMRDGYGKVSKTIVLGASVGFVALLGVKGGATIFIMTNAGVDVPFNPYSTAFAGVVAGMFSEKLYFALSKLTDKAFGEDNTNKQINQDK